MGHRCPGSSPSDAAGTAPDGANGPGAKLLRQPSRLTSRRMSDRRAGAVPARNSGESWLILIGIRENSQKLLERSKVVPLHRSLYHRLHAMIARDKGWIDGAHGDLAACTILRLKAQPLAPADGPGIVSERIDEEADRLIPSGPAAASLNRRNVRVKSAWFSAISFSRSPASVRSSSRSVSSPSLRLSPA